MLKFLEASTNIKHRYYFSDENGILYYWESSNSDTYNSCIQNGKLIGLDVLDFEVDAEPEQLFHNGKWYNKIKVNKWKVCA